MLYRYNKLKPIPEGLEPKKMPDGTELLVIKEELYAAFEAELEQLNEAYDADAAKEQQLVPVALAMA